MAFSLITMISSFVYLIALITSTASPLLINHDEECLALFEFKQSIIHQDYTSSFNGFQKSDSWRNTTNSNMSYNGSDDCCLWNGVVCSSDEGHVIELDLSKSSIRGPITFNSSLFNLVHLRKLNLSMNDFAGSQIPFEIARLKQLRSLDLSDSGFSGEIPNGISHLIKLSVLDLSFNSLKLQTPSMLQNLTRLEKIHLVEVNISSSIPRFLANFSYLNSIQFGGCQLRGEFPSAILHLPKLKYLSIKLNPKLTGSLPEFRNNSLLEYLNLLSTGFVGMIPESIGNLNRLVLLALSDSFFSGSIPSSLSNLTQLSILSLSYNELTGPVPLLATLSKLTYLDFSFNSFEKGCEYGWISKLTKLEELYLNQMNIYTEMLPSLANLTKLNIVSMERNFIFGRIPSSFMNLTQLTIIGLGANQLHGPISSAFSNFKKLEFLDLYDNKFSGRVDQDIFVGLNRLQTLYLGGVSFVTTNNYTHDTLPELNALELVSCDLKEFPAFLRFQKKMTTLILAGNKIGGLIPEWILENSRETMLYISLSGNLITGFHKYPHFLPWVRLEAFYISYIQVRGRLPIPPKSIVLYDVSNNNIIGEIPPLICQAESLQELDLSSNNMTGTLPTCLGNFSKSLVSLNLKQNNFHGMMLNTFTHESQLKAIDLSENRFTGLLPKSLANCTNLQVLTIGDNSFEGVFPFWLGHLGELQVLILRSNNFTGAIQGPSTFSLEFRNLRILDLSNNGFTGQLPEKYFRIWKAMKSVGNSSSMDYHISSPKYKIQNWYSITLTVKGVKREYNKILTIFKAIDLSCNSFEGEIPQSVAELQGLESLNLSNNHLTGYVLPTLGNLKYLESLDLSHNKLSGELPQELLQLGFLAMFNVSFNNLEGHIPTGEQFDTFENYSYVGNPLLCGQPLSNACRHSTTSTPPETSDEYESFLPYGIIDWVVIFLGFGSGLIIGILLGNFLYARYSDWFIHRFGIRKTTWVKPLSSRRRAQVL